MVRVSWSKAAIDDIEAIRLYIAHFNQEAANKIVERLLTAGNRLSLFPNRGRPVSMGECELVPMRNYILRYYAGTTGVFILQVRHAARLPIDE